MGGALQQFGTATIPARRFQANSLRASQFLERIGRPASCCAAPSQGSPEQAAPVVPRPTLSLPSSREAEEASPGRAKMSNGASPKQGAGGAAPAGGAGGAAPAGGTGGVPLLLKTLEGGLGGTTSATISPFSLSVLEGRLESATPPCKIRNECAIIPP